MTGSSTQSLANERVAAERPFFPCNPSGDFLFSVRADVPISDALNQASCFLAVALDVVHSDSDNASGACYLIEMAKAVVDAVNVAIAQAG